MPREAKFAPIAEEKSPPLYTTYESVNYRWIYESADKQAVTELAGSLNIPGALAEVLIKRGVVNAHEVREFLGAPLSSLKDPFLMLDMERGAKRVIAAVKTQEPVCIYGDYDVDGITATALLYLFLTFLNANVTYYIPNRLDEGYGLNSGAIRELAEKGIKLLITVDCGISALKEAALAKRLGLDLVITDHHEPGDALPEGTAIINPMRKDDPYPFKRLSGVGVAFKLCMAVRQILRDKDREWAGELPNLKQYLDIVALGTIADVMPLSGENRVIALHGLKIIASDNVRVGIDELKRVARLKNPLSTDSVSFGLAPRINAVGRLGDCVSGLKLLISRDREEAQALARELDADNKHRKEVETHIANEAFNTIDKNGLAERYNGIVVAGDTWHHGVLGIVASRIAEKYGRPAIVLAREDGILKGSARSAASFHLFEGLKSISDILLDFGGHKFAAGLKISADKLEELTRRFHEAVTEGAPELALKRELAMDAVLRPKMITDNFMDVLSGFEPFGEANERPNFAIFGAKLLSAPYYVGSNRQHIRVNFIKDGATLEAIGFNMDHSYMRALASADLFDLLFSLKYNDWNGERRVQLELKDLRASV